MDLHEYRVLFLSTAGILALLVASPALSRLLISMQARTEFFTELWILDSNHRAEDYPFNITRNDDYSMFLGIRNRLGYCAYYLVEVKFRNQTQSAPDGFNRPASSLEPLFNITAFVEDEGVWELPFTFSIDYRYNETFSRVEFDSLRLNDVPLDMRPRHYKAAWDSEGKGFLCNLFFELWLYNRTSSSFQYHNRFVGLWLNMTR